MPNNNDGKDPARRLDKRRTHCQAAAAAAAAAVCSVPPSALFKMLALMRKLFVLNHRFFCLLFNKSRDTSCGDSVTKHTSITAVSVFHLQTLSLWQKKKQQQNNVFIHIYLTAGICVSNESAAKKQKLLRNTKTYFSLHLPSSGSRSGSMWGCKEGCICFGENLEWPQLKL